MPTYNLAQVIGSTLVAKRPIDIKNLADDNAPVIRQVPTGQTVGVVYAWIDPGPGRSVLHWMFYDNNGVAYYAAHSSSAYEILGAGQEYPIIESDDFWSNIFPDPLQDFSTQVSKYLMTGGLIYLGFKYGPEFIKALKK